MSSTNIIDLPVAHRPHDTLGRPLHDLRISVMDRCNFRCPYCMPADRIPDDHGLDAASRLSFDDIETLVRGFARLGTRKLRITGGEPLLRKHLPELVARLARIDGIDDLALTTNGSLLAAHAWALREAGLHRLTVSLDALDPKVFAAMSGGRGRIDDVLAGLDAARGHRPCWCVLLAGLDVALGRPTLDLREAGRLVDSEVAGFADQLFGVLAEQDVELVVLRLRVEEAKADAELEPNDDPTHAVPIGDGTFVGTLGPGDVDVYRYSSPMPAELSFEATPPERVDLKVVGQLINVRFAGKVVGG